MCVYRLKGQHGGRGKIGMSLCHWPWKSANKAGKTWVELQFKPQGLPWCQAVTASSRQSTLQCVSKPVLLPGFLSRLAFQVWHPQHHSIRNISSAINKRRNVFACEQVAAGVSLWDSSARRRRVQPLLLWKLSGKSAANSTYKLEVRMLETSI